MRYPRKRIITCRVEMKYYFNPAREIKTSGQLRLNTEVRSDLAKMFAENQIEMLKLIAPLIKKRKLSPKPSLTSNLEKKYLKSGVRQRNYKRPVDKS